MRIIEVDNKTASTIASYMIDERREMFHGLELSPAQWVNKYLENAEDEDPDFVAVINSEFKDLIEENEHAKLCNACDGSGEGWRDGTICTVCKGKGS